MLSNHTLPALSLRNILSLMIVLSLFGTDNVQAGSNIRYALVVGNNEGKAPNNLELPALLHAERDAARIHDELIRLGQFDPERVVLLQGMSRAQILKATIDLAAKHKREKNELGELSTLFAFFFSGHGLGGSLLTKDDPITGADLATIFGTMQATFTVGVFDACFSGTLELDKFAAKGLRVLPGFNAFVAMPEAILQAEGTMWFVSSRADQVSYEHNVLGGLFSHYFVDGMQKARSDEIGITLNAIWEYAQQKTVSHSKRSGRPQTPQKKVRRLTSSGPLYFAFPRKRTVILEFDPALTGRFLLVHAQGQLTERVEKRPGELLRISTFPGEVNLVELPQSKTTSSHRQLRHQQLKLKADQTVWIHDSASWEPQTRQGWTDRVLAAKGNLAGLVMATKEPNWSGMLQTGYQLVFGGDNSAIPLHHANLGLRLERGYFSGRLGFAWGHENVDNGDWDAKVDRAELTLSLGAALDTSFCRVGLYFDASLFSRDVVYTQKEEDLELQKPRGGHHVGASLLTSFEILRQPFRLYLDLSLGLVIQYAHPLGLEEIVQFGPILAQEPAKEWLIAPWAGLGISIQLF